MKDLFRKIKLFWKENANWLSALIFYIVIFTLAFCLGSISKEDWMWYYNGVRI